MGLDGYLYRTSKRRVEAAKKFDEIRKAYSADIDVLLQKPRWKELFDSLPKNQFGRYDFDAFTPEQKKGCRNARRAARRVAKKHGLVLDKGCRPIFDIEDFGLNYDDDDLEEIGYWRKDWDLHNYLIKHFGDPTNDNLVEVYLTKDNLKKIVADGYDDGTFSHALRCWNDDCVVFYHPWY